MAGYTITTPAPSLLSTGTTTAQVQAVITSLQAVITQATADNALPVAAPSTFVNGVPPVGYISDDQKSANRQAIAQAQAMIQYLAQMIVPVAPHVYTVVNGDSLFAIAQAQLGNMMRYGEIQDANSVRGLSITPGQQLLLPSV